MNAQAAFGSADAVRQSRLMRIPPFHWWRTVFFLIPAISLYTIVLGTMSLLSTLFDRCGDFGHRCARAWSWLILKTTGVRSTSTARAARPARSYVFAANHQSIYDIPILFASLPFQLRIIAKESLGRIPVPGLASAADRPRAGRSHEAGRGHRQEDGAAGRGRHSLIVFPEGTRSTDGRVARFKGGSFMIALDAGLPVVPISIAGSRHVMFRGGDGPPRCRWSCTIQWRRAA